MNTLWLFLALQVQAQSYDVFTPATAGKAPVLVFLHGGAWRGGRKEDYRDLARRLTLKNLCVALVDYRLSHQAKHPAPVLDLEKALGKMKLPERCDHRRLFLAGHSAGAHLIAFWATRNANADVRGLIGIEGIYDLPKLIEAKPAYADQFVRAEFGPPEKWPTASPARLPMISRSPWLVIHSRADELVDATQATTFRDHLQSEKVHVELIEPKKESHFGIIENLGVTPGVTGKLLKFIEKQKE